MTSDLECFRGGEAKSCLPRRAGGRGHFKVAYGGDLMKSWRAIKEHKSVMHGFSISSTELLQHQVKCFVFIKWAHSWCRFRWGRQEVSHEKQILKNYSWRERAYFHYFLIRELNSIAEKIRLSFLSNTLFQGLAPQDPPLTIGPIQLMISTKQMTNLSPCRYKVESEEEDEAQFPHRLSGRDGSTILINFRSGAVMPCW